METKMIKLKQCILYSFKKFKVLVDALCAMYVPINV
jgi:hypothetical protein